jgi:VWFA-related protein
MFRHPFRATAVLLLLAIGFGSHTPPLLLQAQGRSGQGPATTAAQQRPVFRGGTHFVRVDAYPTQDGQIVEGLEAEDFEILEDGKPQKIDSFDFIRFDTFTPEAARRNPSSQREAFDMAADPRYRLFVLFVNIKAEDILRIRQPLNQFLDRVLGPQDLFGFLTARHSARDLVLGQKTAVAHAMIDDMFRAASIDRDEADELLDQCGAAGPAVKERFRLDQMYTGLESLVDQLGSLRQERKNIILVANDLPRLTADARILESGGAVLPKAGITRGRIGMGDRTGPGANEALCASELQRLATVEFDTRYRELLRRARSSNVTFYAIPPAGLQAPFTAAGVSAANRANDNLITLANETDGLAIVNTNDLSGGMKRIADDLAAYYVLGYYTTNTTFDGGVRTIKVRFKANGKPIRARRQYRAPTQAEIAALASSVGASSSAAPAAPPRPSPYETALIVLERASRPFSVYAAAAAKQLTVVTELSAVSIQAGRWKDGADVEVVAAGPDGEPVATARGRIEPGASSTSMRLPPPTAPPTRLTVRLKGSAGPPADDWIVLEPAPGTLIGDGVAYRTGPRVPTRPVATFEFARTERIRAEWPVLGPLDRREARLLDRKGKPLPVDLPLTEDPATHAVVVEMSLSGLGRGDYLIELTAGGGAVTEKRLLAVRVK